jgi:hypothetical protein
MALGSLALWTAIPAAWLWLTRDLQPNGTRFVISIACSAMTMLAAGALLYRLEAVYARLTGEARPEPAPPRWLRSNRELQRAPEPMTLLDSFMVASAIVALVALVVWWAFLADSPDPSGPLQPV